MGGEGGRRLGEAGGSWSVSSSKRHRSLLLDGAGKGDGVAITLVVGADAGNQRLSNRKQKGGRQVRCFVDELLKRAGGNLEEQALLVRYHVGRTRAMVKESDFAEEFAGSHRHQNAFLA